MSRNDARVAVVGLGYVGLPLARAFIEAGFLVVGVDSSERIVSGLLSGHSHIGDISDSDVLRMLEAGFTATDDYGVVADVQAVVVCVPTPLDASGHPDLTSMIGAARAIGRHLAPKTLVVLESTSHPGTTRDVLRPLLEGSGLVAGQDFNLAFSSERIDPGNPRYSLANTPKVVGGLTADCLVRATALYEPIVPTVVAAKGLEEAEMSKLLENTYRQVNIALANEMAVMCRELGIDVWDVIKCAQTKPFGFQAFWPGPGVGGHCIPIDPTYLAHHVRESLGRPFRMIEAAQQINEDMPNYVAQRAAALLSANGSALSGSTVLLIGVTYKQDVADARATPAIGVANALVGMGAHVRYWDPYVSSFEAGGRRVHRALDAHEALVDCDLAILLQAHSDLDLGALENSERLILDTRGLLRGHLVERL